MIRVAEIQHAVAQHFGLTIADLRGTARERRVARPRQVAMYLSRRMTTRSLQEIGNQFGGRDHTTVLYASRHITKLRDNDPDLHDDVREVLKLIPSARPSVVAA